LPLMPYSNVLNPVVFAPGRARLETKPAPTEIASSHDAPRSRDR
jgi:hypothetical protein